MQVYMSGQIFLRHSDLWKLWIVFSEALRMGENIQKHVIVSLSWKVRKIIYILEAAFLQNSTFLGKSSLSEEQII